MTRYRLKTIRKIETLIREKGPLTSLEISRLTGMERRVVTNYLKTHPGVFKRKDESQSRVTWGLN